MNLLKYKIYKHCLKINKIFSKYSAERIITFLQKISWVFLCIILLIIIGNLVFGKFDKVIPLTAAVGILISALLASYSMLLNITKNIELKNRDIELKNKEHSNLVRDIFFKLCLIKMRLISLENEKGKDKITFMDIDRIFDTVEDTANLLQNIDTKDIITIAHNNVLSDIHFVYLEILTLQTNLKAMRKNLIKPNLSEGNKALFPNPLRIDMRIDIAIRRLSVILQYLKDGYADDFPEEKGIESCAEYKLKETKQKNN